MNKTKPAGFPESTSARLQSKGFTLLETLLVVALLSGMFALSLPVFQAVQNRNDLDIAANSVAQSLRRAQVLSQAQASDATWGVNIGSSNITLFQGASFATRNTDFDETFDLPGSITPSGVGEVVFSKFSGEPQATGDIVLTSSTNETRTVTINSRGAVSF